MKSFIVLLLLSMNFSFAGDRVGNGGGTHYCSKENTAEMYDLYEAKTRYQMVWDENFDYYTEIGASAGDMDRYLLRKLNKMNPYMSQKVWTILNELEGRFVFLKNIDLKEIEDANFLMTNKGCEYAQLANWDETIGKIFVDKELYQKLSLVDTVAFRWHEAIYKFFRDHSSVKNSDYTRKVVGMLFSDIEMPKVYEYDYEKTGNGTFEVTGPNMHNLKMNVPILTYNVSVKAQLITFRIEDQMQLEKLETALKTAKRKEKRALKAAILKLQTMKDRKICLNIQSTTKIKVCNGETVTIPLSGTRGFQIEEQNTAEMPVYLLLTESFKNRSAWMTLQPVLHSDEYESWFKYVGSVGFTFGWWQE